MNIFYTYIYLDPRKKGPFTYGEFEFEYEPFYVGKGHNNRYLSHLIEANNIKNKSWKHNKIRKIKKELKCDPIIKIIHNNLYEKEALKFEIWLIWLIGRKQLINGPLINLTDGGETIIGLIFSDEHKRKISLANKGKLIGSKNPMWEKHHSITTRQKISKASTGKTHSEVTRQKISKANKNKPKSEEHKKKLSKPKSEEHKNKISKSMKGKISGMKGKTHSEETRQKISKKCKGYKHTSEAKNKMGHSYKINYINGEQKIIKNLSTFCSEHNFNYFQVYGCMKQNLQYQNFFVIKI